MTTEVIFPYIDYSQADWCRSMFLDTNFKPMWFVLCTKCLKLKEGLKKFIEFCGGAVNESLTEMDPHAIVLVPDSCSMWEHDGDVFNLSYIETCFRKKKCMDVSHFRHNPTTNLIEEFNYMDIVYFKKYTWDNIPETFFRKEEFSSDESEGDPRDRVITNGMLPFEITLLDTEEPMKRHCNTELRNIKDVTLNVFINKPENVIKKKRDINKQTRKPYTMAEKINILKYIINKKEYERIKGNQLWKKMESKEVCSTRTWQSMKEHFLKKILPEISTFTFLTPKQQKRFQYYKPNK